MCSRERAFELKFTHFVVSSSERVIFAVAREGERVRNFILGKGWAKQQVNSHFEYLPAEVAIAVIQQAEQYLGRVPTYQTKTLRIN